MKDIIINSIEEKRVLHFLYDGEKRKVETHVLGENKKGQAVILAYQVEGYSKSGNPQGWKLFHLEKISDIEIEDETFKGDRSDYNPADKRLHNIIASI